MQRQVVTQARCQTAVLEESPAHPQPGHRHRLPSTAGDRAGAASMQDVKRKLTGTIVNSVTDVEGAKGRVIVDDAEVGYLGASSGWLSDSLLPKGKATLATACPPHRGPTAHDAG